MREAERQPSIHMGNRPKFREIACHYRVAMPLDFRMSAIDKMFKFLDFILFPSVKKMNKHTVEYVYVYEYKYRLLNPIRMLT
jgi:hypothetical protein